MSNFVAYYESPIGWIEIQGTDEGIGGIYFVEKPQPSSENIPSCIKQCVMELDEYFQKKRATFSVPLHLNGTEFQKRVWKKLLEIPYGEVISYGEIAKSINHPKAVRAVGNAVGQNPISIIVPCHRVVRAGGKLGGYAWGTQRKEWLLRHEKS
ncbi:methylated-DNA-[protein]-cysteine S-methyltransferase [Thermolongibacillus altinsuensis]|uniref:Methylated-DNA--protein-cysteine methyltransferase n=1 Tax=Thermolongibacillus altinsuensis TaxID=575256 RepID=A0A4R1QQE9_9BACL|nr:methylated-DNA--[protein]-cysteine S-methyltransferase [Thermolongibacillus altinsuensis]TCL51165.1 methylated-DNA-[protein]-cysteine S-methyltransferase [Thermolongibacillus altinsuensis]GMB08767.1 methylated-DNA--protein-cysteine methyltransferase [Thermolongibacillus altinsuensis]